MFYLTDDGDGVRLMGIYRSSFHHSLAADVRTTVSTPSPPPPSPTSKSPHRSYLTYYTMVKEELTNKKTFLFD